MPLYRTPVVNWAAALVDPKTGRITPYFQKVLLQVFGFADDGAAGAADLTGKQDQNDFLDALSAFGGSGHLVRTGAGGVVARTVTAGAGISVANGSGVAGNPTVTLALTGAIVNTALGYTAANAGLTLFTADLGVTVQAYDADLAGIAALSSTGLIARTAAGAFSARTMTAGSGITLSNGDGVAGNPTVTLNLTAGLINTALGYSAANAANVVAKNTDTGWTAPTGTGSKAGFATYTAPTISPAPTQAEVQAIADAVQALSQTLKSVIDGLLTSETFDT